MDLLADLSLVRFLQDPKAYLCFKYAQQLLDRSVKNMLSYILVKRE